MCVIIIAETKRPTDDLLEQAAERNPNGGGIAWREEDNVHWKKGIEVEEISLMCETLPLPFIVHFRIATTGSQRLNLSHPFPIEGDVSLALEGKAKHVLFHNGTWHAWKHETMNTAAKYAVKIPGGKWSDTRAIAWAAHLYGLGVLDMLDEKCAILGVKDLEIFGTGWTIRDGVITSNRLFESSQSGMFGATREPTMCRDRSCTRNTDLDDYGYCPQHTFKKKDTSSSGSTDCKTLARIEPSERDPLKLLEGQVSLSGETLFLKALRLFKEGKMSKNQFKRVKKAIDKALMLPVC